MHRILVIEDSADIRRLLEHVLRRAGYEVISECEGPAGWECFQRVQPDLVLLDVNLPGLDGVAVCRRIKRHSNTPVILLTVQAESEAARRGIEAGADAYLTKPFEIPYLLTTIGDILRPLAPAGPSGEA